MVQNESSFADWKAELLHDIEAEPDTVSKGDSFVQCVLRYRYQLSDDDAIDATDMAGAGDHGIDGLIIEEAEEGNPAHGIVVQGKYGTAGLQVSPLLEFIKFSKGLQQTSSGTQLTNALERCSAVLENEGTLTYVIATVDPLSDSQTDELENARVIANDRYGPSVTLDAVSLRDLYDEICGQRTPARSVSLTCQWVAAGTDTYVGAATLVNVYQMLREYAKLHNGSLDRIYDRNVRKWLGKRAKSVNAGINNTLLDNPARFIAFNNGISIVCRSLEPSDGVLRIDSPQIVNGCQTTRTLYDFMENRFAGVQEQLNTSPKADAYRTSTLAFKLIAVQDFDTDFVRDITRFSNKQNAVRGRDFLTLEENFHQLKSALLEKGYYLEVQTGEYNVLPKSEKQRFPQDKLVNAFDALRFYGASVLRKPHTAFGRSGEFTPGGNEFDEATKDLTEDDLLVPWLMAGHAKELGYSVGSKKDPSQNDHRNQTRYFYLYMLFRVASQVLSGSPQLEPSARLGFYKQLFKLRDDYLVNGADETAFKAILDTADKLVATYMNLASLGHWFQDRNAFLKNQDLLIENRIVQASGDLFVTQSELRKKAEIVLGELV